MADVLILGLIGLLLFLPILGWYFLFRWIGRSRRARRQIEALAATLTEEQRDEFDRDVLPRTRNISEQRDELVKFVQAKVAGDQPEG
jgi:hypothetical protein